MAVLWLTASSIVVYTDSHGNQQVNETKYEEVGLCEYNK